MHLDARPPHPDTDRFLTITDVARYTGFDRKTVRKYASTQGLPLVQLSSGKRGCFMSALRRWIDTLHTATESI